MFTTQIVVVRVWSSALPLKLSNPKKNTANSLNRAKREPKTTVYLLYVLLLILLLLLLLHCKLINLIHTVVSDIDFNVSPCYDIFLFTLFHFRSSANADVCVFLDIFAHVKTRELALAPCVCKITTVVALDVMVLPMLYFP